ncbi:MAG: hypothetical protein IJ298_04940 [Ruminococcus sp.]|nr:hypothetical protein [Ruminococcus sp.]
MKRLFAVILVCVLVFALGACKPDDTTSTNPSGGSYEINWTVIPDSDVVGAWEPEESVDGEYVLFTDDGKLRVVSGTIVFDAAINYGVDGYGNKSAYTEGNYLYGQWVYTVDGDTLTINYAEDDVQTFKRINYTPITLQAKEDFVKDDRLVGKWLNYQYGDSYEFTEDGFVIFRQTIEDGIYVYDTEIKHSYTVSGDQVTLYFYQKNDNNEVAQTANFTIEGTKLVIGEADYYLNGEGSPEATTAAVIG